MVVVLQPGRVEKSLNFLSQLEARLGQGRLRPEDREGELWANLRPEGSGAAQSTLRDEHHPLRAESGGRLVSGYQTVAELGRVQSEISCHSLSFSLSLTATHL